jgi:hypothetical protein
MRHFDEVQRSPGGFDHFVSRRWVIFRTRQLTQPPTRSRPTGPGYRPKDRNGRLAHVRSSGGLRSEPAVGMTPSHIASTPANGRIRSDAEWIIDPPQVARRPAQAPQYGESLFTRSPSPWILDSTSHILFGSRLTTPNGGRRSAGSFHESNHRCYLVLCRFAPKRDAPLKLVASSASRRLKSPAPGKTEKMAGVLAVHPLMRRVAADTDRLTPAEVKRPRLAPAAGPIPEAVSGAQCANGLRQLVSVDRGLRR